MAHDEPNRDDHPPENVEEAPAVGVVQVTTTDPDVISDDQADEWRRHPDATVATETTALRGPLPLHRAGAWAAAPAEPAAERRRRAEAHRQTTEDREPPPSPSARLGMGSYLLIGGIALLCGLLGAWGYASFFGDSSKQDEPEASGKSAEQGAPSGSTKEKAKDEEAGSKAESASEIPGFTSAEDADTLTKQIRHLAERIDRLGQRIDSLDRPRHETPPAVHTLQNKVGELSREVDEVAELPSKYRRLEERLEELRAEVKTLRGRGPSESDVPATTHAVKGTVEEPSDPPAPTSRALPDDAAMSKAIDLFRRGKHAMAREVFHKMQVTRPDDARVWYYSALARGLTTGDWQGQTRVLLSRGIECERAGTTPTSRIDAALAGLEPSQRRWLASYRDRLAHRE